ncbi:uncharacterized protein LOC125957687 [Anopheles darlingi]|uniref:uncharacterized protein LOC125952265 n=1 Tax=Anopheles darlingi TaxID=43151 RepID=UPI00210044CF|nr:uncharacterized protein LOC125952265 [Anopheles darlingi]XP_049546507.1 uncharacterized protein LOC125957687 [Anopheles darlingi]
MSNRSVACLCFKSKFRKVKILNSKCTSKPSTAVAESTISNFSTSPTRHQTRITFDLGFQFDLPDNLKGLGLNVFSSRSLKVLAMPASSGSSSAMSTSSGRSSAMRRSPI